MEVCRVGDNGSPYMLVDQDDADVLPRLRVLLKRLLDLSRLGLSVDDEEVPLGVRAGGHMLESGVSAEILPTSFCNQSYRVGRRGGPGSGRAERTPMPARRRPVTESCDVLGRLRRGRWTGWAGVKLASSPMTAMNSRSLKSAKPAAADIV